jgi:hypothetical protein
MITERLFYNSKKRPPADALTGGPKEKNGSEKIVPGNCSSAVRSATVLRQAALPASSIQLLITA